MSDDFVSDSIDIEVVYATPGRQKLVALRVSAGTTAMEAIERSRIRDEFPSMVVDENALGIFSRKVGPDYQLQSGDRLEIYRPLIADPKETRRQRARQQQ